jgi:hypothetical protein
MTPADCCPGSLQLPRFWPCFQHCQLQDLVSRLKRDQGPAIIVSSIMASVQIVKQERPVLLLLLG